MYYKRALSASAKACSTESARLRLETLRARLPGDGCAGRLSSSRMSLRTLASTINRTLQSSLPRSAAMSSSSVPAPPTPASLSAMAPADVDRLYRPFHLSDPKTPDWVSNLELDTVSTLSRTLPSKLKLLVLYGSLRERVSPRGPRAHRNSALTATFSLFQSFSRLTSYEAARILEKLGADVRVFSPAGLPMKDGTSEKHDKVLELRALSEWSDGQLWCSPEQHGTITAVMKNQGASRRGSHLRSRGAPTPEFRRLTVATLQLTGSRCLWVPCDRRKGGHWRFAKSTAARNRSTRSTSCGSSAGG